MTVETEGFPPGFFARADPSPDPGFYSFPRLVTHIDEGAVEAVGALYEELDVSGAVLDLMGSWVSHFRSAPEALTVLGMNVAELERNPQASAWVVHDLNADPQLPFGDGSFDDAVCCVSVDYLVAPVEVFREVARVLRPGGRFVCTFSNRCFPTKAVRGWLYADDATRCAIVMRYFALSGRFERPVVEQRPTPPAGDPLFALWARRGDPAPQGGPTDLDEARRRVAAAPVGRLGTVTAAGRPHLVPCCFAVDGDRLHSAVDAKPKSTVALRRLANLAANAAATLLVDHYEDDWAALWWVRVEGRGRIAHDVAERTRALSLLAAKYEQYRRTPPPGPVITIDAERWSWWEATPC